MYVSKLKKGIQKIKNAVRILKDAKLDGLPETDINNIQYHSNNCYSRTYILIDSRIKLVHNGSKSEYIRCIDVARARVYGIYGNYVPTRQLINRISYLPMAAT